MKLEQKRDEYLSKIIHDLKTPTIAQIKALELFLETGCSKITPDEKDLIELTLNSCNYMQNLIEIFSEVEKLNYEQIKLHYEKFNIMDLIEKIIKNLEILLKYRDLKINIISKKEIIVHADKLQLKRVIENILTNCINHAFKNSCITIKLDENKKNFIFETESNSPHIEPEVLCGIFEKYTTFECAYSTASSILGLYLSKEIIKAHYGAMIARSSENNINVFGFKIPKR